MTDYYKYSYPMLERLSSIQASTPSGAQVVGQGLSNIANFFMEAKKYKAEQGLKQEELNIEKDRYAQDKVDKLTASKVSLLKDYDPAKLGEEGAFEVSTQGLDNMFPKGTYLKRKALITPEQQQITDLLLGNLVKEKKGSPKKGTPVPNMPGYYFTE